MFIEIADQLVNAIFACIPRKAPLIPRKDIKLIAHRGAHAKDLRENTMAAFQRAVDLGCWGIELDIHSTKDGVIVVNHDPTLKRLWQHDASIADLNFETLRKLEPDIPTLKEVIDAFGTSLHYFIEIKTPFYEEAALFEVLKSLKPCDNYHLLSLEEPLFAKLSLFPKKALMLVPVHNNVRKFCQLSLREGYGGVLGNYLLLTNALIKQLTAKNQDVGVGFINSKNSLYRELKRPIPWIFTDNAEKVSALLKSCTLENKNARFV